MVQDADAIYREEVEKAAENWKKELKRIAGLVRKLDTEEFDRPDNYDDIKNEVLDWMRNNFDDLWD